MSSTMNTTETRPILDDRERAELLQAFYASVCHMRRLLARVPADDARYIGGFVIDATRYADDPEAAAFTVGQIERTLQRRRASTALILRLVPKAPAPAPAPRRKRKAATPATSAGNHTGGAAA